MIKQEIVRRKYTTRNASETVNGTTFRREIKEYETYDDFVNKVTNVANELDCKIISISYPDYAVAVITYLKKED